MPRHMIPTLILLIAAIPMPASTAALEEVPLIGSPCEGCEAAFDGVPERIPVRLVLADAHEPGEPMTVQGSVLDASGDPRPGVVLYVHQTNHEGRYPELGDDGKPGHEARRHGRLRGWVRSDAGGRFRIDTVRPGSYPGTDIPQHIHVQVIEPGCFTYLVDDVLFTDDPRLTSAYRDRFDQGMGGSGVVTPSRIDGRWNAERTIHLGAGIPGHRPCPSGSP